MSRRFAVSTLVLLLLGLLAAQLTLGVCVQEDAFISFRYARNLVDGHGLVYNSGESVEGYTNFLWTVIMAGGMAVKLDPIALSRFLGMTCALALVTVCFLAARRRSAAGAVTGGLIAAVAVAASPAVLVESVQGLETVFFALLVTGGLILYSEGHRHEASGAEGAARLLTAGAGVLVMAALTRPEGVGVFGLATAAALAWRLRRRLRPLTRNITLAAGLFVVVYLIYWFWRYSYYGYPLPNTFYAKTGGGVHHLWQGLQYVGSFLVHNPVLTLLTAIAAVRALWRRPASSRIDDTSPHADSPTATMLITVTVGYLGYVATVGGDFKSTFRFIIPVLPIWAVLLDGAFAARGWPLPSRLRTGRSASVGAVVVVTALLVNSLFSFSDAKEWTRKRAWDLKRRTAAGRYLAENAPPDAVLAIHSAGIIPYVSGLRTIDMWGLSDLHIAHKDIPDMGRSRRIGHEKHDAPYVFGRWPTYHVPEYLYIYPEPQPDLVNVVFQHPIARQRVGVRYRARSIPLTLDDGKGAQTYYFNFLELRR